MTPPLSRRGALFAGAAALMRRHRTGRRCAGGPPRARRPRLAALTPLQRAGQRVIHSYPGLTPPASLMTAIKQGHTAGVIFFGDNIQNLSQIESVINSMKAAHASSPVKAPLLLMTDQEGGVVRRLPGEPVKSAKDVGASADPHYWADFTGSGAGMNLAGIGMNVNLAPVLDVYRKDGDFTDQYERSYSKSAAAVASCGSAFITAQQGEGVAATAKHFPGLGPATASQNTDLRAVTISTSVSTLRSVDEAPYRDAIAHAASSWSCSRGPSTPPWTPAAPPVSPRRSSASCATGSASRASRSPTPWRPAPSRPTAVRPSAPSRPRPRAWTSSSARPATPPRAPKR